MYAHGLAGRTPVGIGAHTRSHSASHRVLAIAWALLLVFGAFFLFAAVSDLLADLHSGIPSDHVTTFSQVAGMSWQHATQVAPALVRYITLLEFAYAIHELVFGVLFLVIVAIPFRHGRRWAWWACWAPMLANLAYSLTFGRHDPTILARSLVADIGLPVLLILHIPSFFSAPARRAGGSSHPSAVDGAGADLLEDTTEHMR
jgi:hypothetical protein